ncbi:MAG: hypothetical protein KAT04_15340 [Methylococcales bacterium]|nr:hypothetical protein [Methylococcales bacterium]
MKIYRGAYTRDFSEHENVSNIGSKDLEDAIEKGKSIKFDINKDASERERRSECTAIFEDKDIMPMMKGALSNLSSQQAAFLEIERVVSNNILDNEDKIKQIQKAINEYRCKWVGKVY